jgi:hypothetical protein
MQIIQRARIKPKIIAYRLEKLGCTEEQIRRHLARGKEPPAVVQLRPRPLDWRSGAARIRNADSRGWEDTKTPGEPK